MALVGSLKALARQVAPERVVAAWQLRAFKAEQARDQGRALQDVFQDIYELKTWAREATDVRYNSGPGSAPQITARYEDYIVGLLERRTDIKTLVDIGCGDFQVAGRILARVQRPLTYVGCDIAANVVAYNQARFGRDGVSFRQLDVSRDAPPAGDLVTIREVFQHLSNATILAAIERLRPVFREAVITESLHTPCDKANVDLVSGYRTREALKSGVYVDLAPFNLRVIEEMTTQYSEREAFRTALVGL